MSEVPWPRTPWDPEKAAMRPEVINEIMEYRANKLLYDRQSHTPERRKLRRAKPLLGTERIVVCGPKQPFVPAPCVTCGEPRYAWINKQKANTGHCKRCGIALAVQTRMARKAARTAGRSG